MFLTQLFFCTYLYFSYFLYLFDICRCHPRLLHVQNDHESCFCSDLMASTLFSFSFIILSRSTFTFSFWVRHQHGLIYISDLVSFVHNNKRFSSDLCSLSIASIYSSHGQTAARGPHVDRVLFRNDTF